LCVVVVVAVAAQGMSCGMMVCALHVCSRG
jgi:hypothetical protein